jgi:hypothetical protein
MQLPLVWLLAQSMGTGGDRRTSRGRSIHWEQSSKCSHPPVFSAADRCAFALAAFAILQAAAVAYTRGAGLPEFRPLSRYQDPLILGAAAQLYAAVRLATTRGRPGRLLLLGWSGVAVAGLISLTATHFALNLPYKRAKDAESLAQIGVYVHDSNSNAFARGTSFSGPDSNPAEAIRVLDDPLLRPVLPKEFREDVARPWLLVHAAALTSCSLFLFVSVLVLSVTNAGSLNFRKRTLRGHAG